MSFQGKKNVYTCPACRWRIVTVDLDEGVTPFQISCGEESGNGAGCGGGAYSSFYRVDQSLEPTHEWYRPDAKETKQLGRLWRDHLAGGGLKLRPIKKPEATA